MSEYETEQADGQAEDKEPATDEQISAFTNKILADWEAAMDGFFRDVAKAAAREGLLDSEVERALQQGYGDDVADSWLEWSGE